MLLGITGNMGCGKSTAAKLFEAYRFKRIDLDQIVRDHALRDAQMVQSIRKRHPSAVDERGGIQRPVLARIIFADENERLWLENLIHPFVHAVWHRMVREAPQSDWIIEVPLLFEKNLEKEFDLTLCVVSSLETQLARLEERGVPRTLARQRISSQLPLDIKIQRSDIIINNDGTLESLKAQISYIITSIKTNL